MVLVSKINTQREERQLMETVCRVEHHIVLSACHPTWCYLKDCKVFQWDFHPWQMLARPSPSPSPSTTLHPTSASQGLADMWLENVSARSETSLRGGPPAIPGFTGQVLAKARLGKADGMPGLYCHVILSAPLAKKKRFLPQH